MAGLFLAIGLILTERNAPIILSGYNTLSAEERKKVDIAAFVAYFRQFHVFMAISFLVLSLTIMYAIDETAGGIFLGIYPILCYIYLIATSRKYYNGVHRRWHTAGIVILVLTTIFVAGLFIVGLQDNRLEFSNDTVTLTGMYGEELKATELESISLVDQLPEIVMKTNGFALGNVSKGYFKTDEGAVVKLMVNKPQPRYLLLTKTDKTKIYFSAKDTPNEQLFAELKSQFPGLIVDRVD